jgi:hypothetical protein
VRREHREILCARIAYLPVYDGRSAPPLDGLMLGKLPFPMTYVLEALLVAPAMAGFVGITAFLDATPIASLNLDGKQLPATWEAAIPSHGNFVRGYLIANHPFAFAAVVVLVIVTPIALYLTRRAAAAQRSAAPQAQLLRHKIANGCVFVVWGICTYILIMRLLVGVPAV